ncbi:POK18 protein, partial [Menura novaehollandiae]|nr:POK18 protein [Menura novaehollandiae]
RDVIKHFQRAFSVLGVPKTIKTDNGLSYVSRSLNNFLCLWGVSHTTGMPHSPTGQAIVERAHGT